MKTKEAIEILTDYIEAPFQQWLDAKDMAVKALLINQKRLEMIIDIKTKIALGKFNHKVHSENYTLDEIVKALEECEVKT